MRPLLGGRAAIALDAEGRGAGPARCRVAAVPGERALHHAIRAAVFVDEQGLFAGSDRDAHDDAAATVHVLAHCGASAAGAVRLYPLDGTGLWKGDRLAVLPGFRRQRVGGPLVRFAVATAAARGGREMVAHVQPPNVALFVHLGWHPVGDLVHYVGRPHQQMAIGLSPRVVHSWRAGGRDEGGAPP